MTFLGKHKQLGEAIASLKKEQEALEKEFETSVITALKEVMGSLYSFSLSGFPWDNGVTVYYYVDSDDDGITTMYGKIAHLGWKWFKITGLNVYPEDILVENREPLFDGSKVEEACASLTEKWGVKVSVQEFRVKTIENPENFWEEDIGRVKDLRLIHPGCVTLGEGDITRVGWNYTSPWAVIQDEKGRIHVYHGWDSSLCYKKHLVSPGDIRKFLDLFSDPSYDFGTSGDYNLTETMIAMEEYLRDLWEKFLRMNLTVVPKGRGSISLRRCGLF